MLIPLALAALLIPPAHANTEKTIFLGPATANIPATHPTLEDLHIATLTPDSCIIRTHLEAQFPNSSSPHGKPTWVLLDELSEGQRYEVRICCLQQPTAFSLATYELQTVFESPELVSELSEYSWSRQSVGGNHEPPASSTSSTRDLKSGREASVLFLRILTAADYYTMNKTLMVDVPPVFVDIILDPFVLNVLPRSLVPTVGYIIVVAITSWFLARQISTWIRQVAVNPDPEKKVR
ncbi:hypothetical protein F4779DRAFT_571577 [Xylariaceae sp. FL0662B]|nr:hypothetical protein F4779DRAFT_571577 [Xylariaceae sp. FL0662B]